MVLLHLMNYILSHRLIHYKIVTHQNNITFILKDVNIIINERKTQSIFTLNVLSLFDFNSSNRENVVNFEQLKIKKNPKDGNSN